MTTPHPGGITDLPVTGPIRFAVDGEQFTFPNPPARDWLDALALQEPACWWQLIPETLTGDERHRLLERLHDPLDHLDLDPFEDAALAVLGVALGCDFWAGRRLACAARADWMAFDGWATEHAFDPLTAPIHRTINAVYALRLQQCEKDADRFKLDREIFAPPTGNRASGRPWINDCKVAEQLDLVESEAFLEALGRSARA